MRAINFDFSACNSNVEANDEHLGSCNVIAIVA